MTKRSDKRKGKPTLTITGTTQSGKDIINNRYIVMKPPDKYPGTYRDLTQSKELYRHRKRLAAKKAVDQIISEVAPEDVSSSVEVTV